MVFAKRLLYRFTISGSGDSNLLITSKHCVNWVKTSTTELEKSEWVELCWNYNHDWYREEKTKKSNRSAKMKSLRVEKIRRGKIQQKKEVLMKKIEGEKKWNVKKMITKDPALERKWIEKEIDWKGNVTLFHQVLTPSLLSRRKALLRKSRDATSFSFSHCITKGSNHLDMIRQRFFG